MELLARLGSFGQAVRVGTKITTRLAKPAGLLKGEAK